ncbi:asparagine synthase (glutamine-hydrolyzing) [Sphingomonas soli]|uniref:asparagine synthase (glutamine-hydrolyzing) n=1 Tax=Sphingomonas soli TaxID=266127 RepID=UPI00082E9FD1|nr:asparagine synthase (glutamine-hydrolyzing) [Sphingomonas soli]
MCGIAGFVSLAPMGADAATRIVTAMADRIRHRGPDAGDVWVDAAAGVALGHRRLSIVDLSSAGAQPMDSASGRFTLVYNGEIYNHAEIREALGGAGRSWRGHSDTETLLAAIEAWGIERALQACAGMFALALWDRHERSLTLARDRMGEKPLYLGWQGQHLLFGSEIKALQAHPAFERQIDTAVLGNYFRFGNTPGRSSIWAGIGKLPPGSYLTYRLGSGRTLPEPTLYWSIDTAAEAGRADRFRGSAEDAADALGAVLSKAVGQQMVADVPLGAFLSGGIDSSTIVSQMQAQSARPIKTFTIGFEEPEYDESVHAEAVARHLDTEQTTLKLTAADAQAVVPSLAALFDEPFGDTSAIPTLLVSRLARQEVTVALSGDGADELFAGYSRYHSPRMRAVWNFGRLAPGPLRTLAGRRIGGAAYSPSSSRDPAAFLAGMYDLSLSQWRVPPVIGSHGTIPATAMPKGVDHVGLMMLADTHRYLPDDILTKVDRTAMSVSLETRAPFLDHRVVEFAMRLPTEALVRDGVGKMPLRNLLYRSVPREILERPKMGFAPPIDHWIRGPLREWAEDLLSAESLGASGLLDVAAIRARWTEHLSGQRNHRDPLWIALMFQSWLRENAA